MPPAFRNSMYIFEQFFRAIADVISYAAGEPLPPHVPSNMPVIDAKKPRALKAERIILNFGEVNGEDSGGVVFILVLWMLSRNELRVVKEV